MARTGGSGIDVGAADGWSVKTLRSPGDLADAGLVGRERLGALQEVAARYAVAITPAIAELIDPSDPHDPIARQFVPDVARA